jgi:organic radical activating enzyme
MPSAYCPMPFVTLTVNPGNFISRCMMSLSKMGPIEYDTYSNTAFQTLRANQLAGVWDKEGCDTCYNKEQDGQQSQRTKWLAREQKYLRETGIYDSNKSIIRNRIYHLYMNFSNICNFKCRMCGPHFSNSWISDYNKLSDNITWIDKLKLKDTYKQQVDVDKFLNEYGPELGNLRQIWITGGEPFIDDTIYDFFDKLPKYADLSKIYVCINTNGSRLNLDKLSRYDKLFKLQINVSVDATEEFYNYMRGNRFTFTELDQIIRQLTQLSKTQQNLLITVNGAFQLYNLTNIGKFFYWANDVLDENDAGHIEYRVLSGPVQLKARNAPETLKAESRRQVDKLLNEFPNQFYLPDIQDELNKPSNQDQIQMFVTWNQELDTLRQQSIHNILPSLYTDWQMEGHII